MDIQARIPAEGSIVARSHCILSSVPVHTIFALRDQDLRSVIAKNYFVDESNISDVRLMLLPITQNHASDESENEEVVISNVSFSEMLESIAEKETLTRNGTAYPLLRKVFYQDGENWVCELIVRNNNDEVIFRRDNISNDQFTRIAKVEDRIATTNSTINKRTFTQVQGLYSITLEAGGSIYRSVRNIDFNHVFFIANQKDHVKISEKIYTIESKYCNKIHTSGSDLHYIYLNLK
jgi:hypothetical protein